MGMRDWGSWINYLLEQMEVEAKRRGKHQEFIKMVEDLHKTPVPMPKGDMEFVYPGNHFGRWLCIFNALAWGAIILFVWGAK